MKFKSSFKPIVCSSVVTTGVLLGAGAVFGHTDHIHTDVSAVADEVVSVKLSQVFKCAEITTVGDALTEMVELNLEDNEELKLWLAEVYSEDGELPLVFSSVVYTESVDSDERASVVFETVEGENTASYQWKVDRGEALVGIDSVQLAFVRAGSWDVAGTEIIAEKLADDEEFQLGEDEAVLWQMVSQDNQYVLVAKEGVLEESMVSDAGEVTNLSVLFSTKAFDGNNLSEKSDDIPFQAAFSHGVNGDLGVMWDVEQGAYVMASDVQEDDNPYFNMYVELTSS